MPTVNPLQLASGLADTVYLSLRPPPDAPDGYYDYQVDEAANTNERRIVDKVVDKLSPLLAQTEKPQLGVKAATLKAGINKLLQPEAENDRLGAFEDLLSVMSMAPPGSKLGKDLAEQAVGVLYNAIPHPPQAYLGPKYAFRQADGGLNNLHIPDYGRAGTPYARSVQPQKSVHPSALPDTGLVFDTLLKATDRVDHKGGNSGLTFAFATLVTHSLFKSSRVDIWINEASSYLDLSPLYGNDAQTVQDIRSPESDGRGLLRPDTFADGDLNSLPPAASALLVMFNRNHNYIAEMLLKLNEKKRWSSPPPTDPAARKAQDDEIFETARLVNCGHFISMIMKDYVSGFLGLSEGNAWNMNAFDPIKFRDGTTVARGEGNHVSVEFNLLYRWHTTVSEADVRWTEEFFANAASFQGQSMEKIELKAFIPLLIQEIEKTAGLKPHERTFAGLKRGPDGRFPSDQIAKILQDATESPAGQYRARGTPAVLRPIEILGMEQARKWGVCTMNEFRKFMGLKQFDSFEEWNPDKDIVEAARRLYGHIDNLELYPGLQCEQYMPLSAGLRFSCGYTMTRAVLSDAIALVRGDRFFTTFYTPVSLTSWGFQDASTRPENGGFGGHLPKLLMRHFGPFYPYNNVYGVFPFFTPQKMKDSLERQGIAQLYSFTRPAPPQIPIYIDTFEAINFVFNDPERFVSGYNMQGLGDGYGFVLAMDDRKQHDADKSLVSQATFGTQGLVDGYVQWFRDTVTKETEQQSWKAGDSNYVDIVEVIKTVYTRWAADLLCGIPLKTKENPRAQYTTQEVFDMFADLNILKGWAREVGSYIWPPDDSPWFEFISRLASTGRPVNQLVANIVGLAVGSSVNHAHAAINVVDFYLDESRKEDFEVIQKLISQDNDQSNELLRGYVREAMRLNPQFTGLWRVSKVEADIPGTNYKVQPGDHIWGGFKKAHLNPDDFPNPLKVDPTRDPSKYQLNGGGFHLCIGVSFAVQVITDTLKIIYSLKNVKRAPGDRGRLAGTTKIFNQVETNVYVKPDGSLTDWPVSMLLVVRDYLSLSPGSADAVVFRVV
ncbi:heme peroxidase [Leucogyrophana mollusca]|uniref:Heme peroxidase n=1 Tax=Leucogyrophana mollusca TaxID=85980 RepID=A0ACB8BRK6_9AGAM|nr:heme peroxidase [Leucogyrophana mollusca]